MQTTQPNLNRLERLILTTLTLRPDLTQTEIAESVHIASPWYLRNAIRTLSLLGLISVCTADVTRYSVTTTGQVIA